MRSSELEKIKRIQITAKQRVLDLFYGAYRSAFKGRGIEFEDIREYIHGDDIRAMSWSRTATMGKPYVKTFQEERDLTVTLMVDISASLNFGSLYDTKRERLAEIGALLAFSAIYNHDRVSLLLFSDRVERYIPAKRGDKHGVSLIRELLSYTPSGCQTDIAQALHFLQSVQKKRSIVFLLSDFISPPWEHAFVLAEKKLDLIAIRIQDPEEEKLSTIGLVYAKDLETGEIKMVDIDHKAVAAMTKKREQATTQFHAAVASAGGSYIDVATHRSYEEALLAFFHKRKRGRFR